MKIAILVQARLPKAGGAHTWVASLLDAVGESCGDTSHEFVVVGPDASALRALLPAPTLRIVESPSGPRSPLEMDLARARRFGRRLKAEAGRYLPDTLKERYAVDQRSAITSDGLSRLYAAEGVEFVWHPTPYCRPTDVPYAVTVWDLQHRLQPMFPEVGAEAEWAKRERAYTAQFGRASLVVAGSERCKEEVTSFYSVPPENIAVNPFPTPSFAIAAPESTDAAASLRELGVQGSYFLYPAQYWPHKNHINLLLALGALRRKQGLTPGLVLVGSDVGAHRGHVRHWVEKLGLQEQVVMPGFVPTETLVALYRGAVAMPYVSYFGPDNLPPLEAFALGCPVIAADVPGARAQYGEAALYVDPSDVDGWAAALAAMYESEELRRRHRELGAARAREWTARDYAYKMYELFDRLAIVRRCWGQVGP